MGLSSVYIWVCLFVGAAQHAWFLLVSQTHPRRVPSTQTKGPKKQSTRLQSYETYSLKRGGAPTYFLVRPSFECEDHIYWLLKVGILKRALPGFCGPSGCVLVLGLWPGEAVPKKPGRVRPCARFQNYSPIQWHRRNLRRGFFCRRSVWQGP